MIFYFTGPHGKLDFNNIQCYISTYENYFFDDEHYEHENILVVFFHVKYEKLLCRDLFLLKNIKRN